jgi:cytochrome d ubiquinol oxidase subunit I
MLATAWFSLWYIFRQKIMPKWFAKILVLMTGSGGLATLAGWYTTEIGRQPWLVTNILLTQDAVAKTITQPLLLTSLSLYLSLYAILIVSCISVIFYLAGKSKP